MTKPYIYGLNGIGLWLVGTQVRYSGPRQNVTGGKASEQ
jgi:hypothetical protein